MKSVGLLCLLCLRIALSQATNHWMVTETGLIQPKDDSPFLMGNPFDLLSFLNQDTRWENIFNLYHNLIYRQKCINQLWVKLEADANFDKHIGENEFCQKVGNIDTVDWYTSFLEDGRFKGIPEKEFSLQRSEYGDTEVPDCKKISSLTFSMFAFEHLDSMINREHLNATPEFALPELFAPIMTVDQFGHWLADVLRKNSSSWLHYNLAAIYWRVKGNVPKALECSRRAVHYAPRQFKNIALLCLGSILHRSRHSGDATVVLGAAVDHDPGFLISHFALGGALAVSGDFNSSLRHLDLSMKLHSKFELADKFRNGVLCHLDMFKKIHIAQSTLKELSRELEEYTNTESQWLKFQTAFLKTMKHEHEYDYKNIDTNCVKMSEITGLKIKELKKDGDRYSLVQYFIESPTYNEEWMKERGVTAIDTAQSLQRIIKHIGKHAGLPSKLLNTDVIKNKPEILKEIGPIASFPDVFPDPKRYRPQVKAELKIENPKYEFKKSDMEMGTLNNDPGKLLYPSNFKVNRNKEAFDTDPNWPSNAICKEAAPKFPENMEAVFPVFLPFENKGIKLSYLLTERIGVPALVEHELPWHPPLCPRDRDLAQHTQRKGLKIQMVNEAVATEVLRNQLLRYLSDSHLDIVKHMQDAEIGQRIQTAIEKKLASKWVLFTIASLYWRVRGNTAYALNCLLTAQRTTDTRYRDVVLVSMASVFLEMGLVDEASNHVEEAYKISPYEPATNFLLAQLSMIKKNHKAHMFHLKQAIRVEPRYMGGIARLLLYGWACVLKQVNTLRELGDLEGERNICAEVEPGVSMVCERDGTNCHISNRHCDSGHKRESSTIVRMLELKDDTIQGAPVDDMDDAIFDRFIDAMPSDRSDKAAHQKNYDVMMRMVTKILKGCGNRGCSEIEAEDLALKEEDCSFQHLQLDYWLHIISFRQQLTDTDIMLPVEITTLPPSTRKVPDCRLPLDPTEDFFIERILKVDTTGWVPVLSLMHQFAELFSFYDYASLGSKIARYIETRPTSWVGHVAAGWWCGAGGRGVCATRCLAAAHALAPSAHAHHALRPLAALLHMQSKPNDAKDIAYLSFYSAPKSKTEAFLVGVSHTYKSEYEQAVWMYRYALTFDEKFLPAKACLHITMCLMLFGDTLKKKPNETPA